MLTFDQIYKLDAPITSLTTNSPSAWWFPEVNEWDGDWDLLERLDAQGRFQIKTLGYENGSGDRYAFLASVWFDGQPVMVVQEAGRSGRDHQRRWITDKLEYVEMCQYLRKQIEVSIEPNDVVDPATQIYPEEIFNFYGMDFGLPYGHGFAPEPRQEGYMLMKNSRDSRHTLVAGVDPDHYLVFISSKVKEAPLYIRRDSFVMKRVQEVTDEQHAINARIKGIGQENKYDKYYWYEHVARPENERIVSV